MSLFDPLFLSVHICFAGKIVNPSGKAPSTVLANATVKAVMKILGIKGIGQVFTDRKQLRYGRVMIMADQSVEQWQSAYTH